jgi:hypothetical protein
MMYAANARNVVLSWKIAKMDKEYSINPHPERHPDKRSTESPQEKIQ